jgi:hypothetical protein
VPQVGGLSRDEGWINMQVQFVIDQKTAGSDKLLVGWTVLPPGARHDKHRHPNADEFFIVIKDSLLVCNGFSLFRRPVLPAEAGGKASNRRSEIVNETCRR